MGRSLALLALMASCHAGAPVLARDQPPADASPIASATPSASTSAAAFAPPAPDVCAGFAESMQTAKKKALARFAPSYGAPVRDARTPVGFCRATPHGQWRVEMPDLAGTSTFEAVLYAIEARFRIVHVDSEGHRATHVMKETLSDYGARDEPREPVVFDWDGDGEPEIYVELHEQGDEGHRASQIEVLTFRSGAVAPYAQAQSLDVAGLEDVDHDGRPDLLVYAGYDDALSSCGAGFPYGWPPARFVAHATASGDFSRDDAAAKAHARTWCPAPPATIGNSAAAICARLWARTPSDVARERARVARCTVKACEDDCSRGQTWFAKTPPLTL